MYGVCTGCPNFVESFVVALKRTEIRYVSVSESRTHFLKLQVGFVAQHVYSHETETRVAAFGNAHSGDFEGKVA